MCDFRSSHSSEHACNPTIIIDLKEFSNAITCVFDETLHKGGVFDKYISVADLFLTELIRCNVDLVFYAKERIYEDSEQVEKDLAEVTCVASKFYKLQRNNNRLLHNMVMVAKQHGQLNIVSGRYKNSIVKYANDHADKVLSIIANDTDYLVYDGTYQYWSMTNWSHPNGFIELHGLRFDRSSLLAEIGLNSEQIRLLATLSDTMDNWFKIRNQYIHLTCQELLKQAIEYVKKQCLIDGDSFDWKQIATYLYGGMNTAKHAAEFEKRYNKFDTNNIRPTDNGNDHREETSRNIREVFEFFTKNHISSYHAIVDCDRKIYFLKDLCCLNKYVSENIEFTDIVFTVLAKLPGILYKDKHEKRRPISRKLFNPLIRKYGLVQRRVIIYPPGKT